MVLECGEREGGDIRGNCHQQRKKPPPSLSPQGIDNITALEPAEGIILDEADRIIRAINCGCLFVLLWELCHFFNLYHYTKVIIKIIIMARLPMSCQQLSHGCIISEIKWYIIPFSAVPARMIRSTSSSSADSKTGPFKALIRKEDNSAMPGHSQKRRSEMQGDRML